MKNLVCIFAHPDDEAFGPAGTIAKLSKKYNIYLLCATKGESGQISQKSNLKSQKYNSKLKSLSNIRADELKRSAKILGIKKVFFLGFRDGTLSNNLYHKLAAKVQLKLKELKPGIVITYEPQGVSGHIDHITVSMVTMFIAQKLKFVKEVWQVCRPSSLAKRMDYFIYFPPGYKKSQIDKIVNIKDVWDIKVEAMKAHKSQLKDFKRIMKLLKNQPKEEYFLVKKLH